MRAPLRVVRRACPTPLVPARRAPVVPVPDPGPPPGRPAATAVFAAAVPLACPAAFAGAIPRGS